MGNFAATRKQDETSSLTLGDDDPSALVNKKDQESMLSMESYTTKKNRTNYLEIYRLYRQTLPYVIEDYLGINMNYYTSTQVPNNLITIPERRIVKDNQLEDLKKLVYKGMIEIDDPIDSYSKHTLLHDVVTMNRQAMFDFLVGQGANLMVRDQNGYTPLLKAAALGRVEMVKRLVEGGVDPRHIDRYGNTPRDKAILYNRFEIQKYLQEMEQKADKGELQLVNWKAPERIRRSGRYIIPFDY